MLNKCWLTDYLSSIIRRRLFSVICSYAQNVLRTKENAGQKDHRCGIHVTFKPLWHVHSRPSNPRMATEQRLGGVSFTTATRAQTARMITSLFTFPTQSGLGITLANQTYPPSSPLQLCHFRRCLRQWEHSKVCPGLSTCLKSSFYK